MLVRGSQESVDSIEVTIDPNDVFDEICLEPRLVTFERLEREADIRARGHAGPMRVSELYQRVLLDVQVGE
jgi:hypothetical protein